MSRLAGTLALLAGAPIAADELNWFGDVGSNHDWELQRLLSFH